MYKHRLISGLRAGGWHLLVSLIVAAFAATLVFGIWYPSPFIELSGGRELFLILIAVDVICGPAITCVLYSPTKSRRELLVDMAMVACLQLVALSYGVWTMWNARPLFLVHEVERLKVINAVTLKYADLSVLADELKPRILKGPQLVGLRDFASQEERIAITLESVQGGRDIGERPEFYKSYSEQMRKNSYILARPIEPFLKRYPQKALWIQALPKLHGVDYRHLRYLPVLGRQDWVAILLPDGQILDMLPGDGFL